MSAFIKILFVLIVLIMTGGGSIQTSEPSQGLRVYTRGVEFDFVEWTIKAVLNKAVGAALKAEKFLASEEQADLVQNYITQTAKVLQLERELESLLNNPKVEESESEVSKLVNILEEEKIVLRQMSKLAESIIQTQTEQILSQIGFGLGGQIFPPVLYHVTDLPLNLIVSPREEIRNMLSLSLEPGLSAYEKELIEQGIQTDFDLSALVEPVGGLGAYPTMVMRTTNLEWLTETIAHEWTHNYLTFRPLGARYFVNDQMRTINETTASISGKEIGVQLMLRHYPESIQHVFVQLPELIDVPRFEQELPTVFNYRGEMRVTRMKVDALLSAGRTDEAEKYMEERRKIFWENGYQIRKINQAYFAFYGSYNDTPGGGASGDDPVGPAVQELRANSSNLHAFIRKIQNVKNFEDLQRILR